MSREYAYWFGDWKNQSVRYVLSLFISRRRNFIIKSWTCKSLVHLSSIVDDSRENIPARRFEQMHLSWLTYQTVFVVVYKFSVYVRSVDVYILLARFSNAICCLRAIVCGSDAGDRTGTNKHIFASYHDAKVSCKLEYQHWFLSFYDRAGMCPLPQTH